MNPQTIQDLEARARTVAQTRGVVITVVAIVALAAFGLFARCSGAKAAHEADRRTAVQQVLKQNTTALASADTAARARHAGVAKANAVANGAVARAAAAEGHYHTARATFATARARVDSAPADTATLAAAVHAADSAVAQADTTIAKKDSALDAGTAERDSLVADTVAIARQRDLQHERADTLQHELERSDAGGCGKLCTVGKVTVYAAAGAAIYNIGRQILRALFVGPAKVAPR